MSTSTQNQLQGAAVTLKHSGYQAIITEVGANLSSLTSPKGRQLVLPAPPHKIREAARGALLAPWPNRIAEGRYTWKGAEYQLPINEPTLRNAIHGLADWTRWELNQAINTPDSSSVTANLHLVPQPGYPFPLKLTATYTLTAQGLTTTFTALNTGETTAPYALGAHPYLMAGTEQETPGAVDSWNLTAPVSTYLKVNESMIPTQELPLTEDLNLADTLPLKGINLDHAFGGIQKTAGEAHIVLTAPNGEATRLTIGDGIGWLQFYTDGTQRRALAAEPMTAPANAFNSGTDLIELEPHQSHTSWWRIQED
ncbi:aldose 1-epimerase family protein [Rothia nasimurium]|uniref:aldose 1-epimerase family protein n=1 Tax=Rothia nasimurium TaxID=85336 RepID=UPI001F1C8D7C|nr:aldose 1-epimerase family protein [Rothia nasimurium]